VPNPEFNPSTVPQMAMNENYAMKQLTADVKDYK
jgi:hypothetical protein